MKAPLATARKHRSAQGTARSTIIRFGLAGGLTMMLIFIGAWAAAQLPYGPTPVFVEIFTYAPPATTDALYGGTLVAALSGFVAAAILAVAYGALEFVERLASD